MSGLRRYSEIATLKDFFDIFGRSIPVEGPATRRLAEGLGTRFLDVTVQVAWRWSPSGFFAGHCWDGEQVVALSSEDLEWLRARWSQTEKESGSKAGPGIDLFRLSEGDWTAFGLCRGERSLLLVGFRGDMPGLDKFQQHLQSLRSLYYFARTEELIAASAEFSRRLEKLETLAEGSSGERELSGLEELVKEAKEVLENDELVRFLVSATETAVARLAACGGDVRPDAGKPFSGLIAALTEGLPEVLWSHPELAPRLRLVEAFDSKCDREISSGPADPAFDLMTAWTRGLVRNRDHLDIEVDWQRATSRTRTELANLLQRWSRDRSNESEKFQPSPGPWKMGLMRAHHVPHWLRLWFCQEILEHAATPKVEMSEVQGRRFQESLAYVVREGLRFFVFGRRADYRTQSEALAQALRTLVEYHAVQIVELPAALDVRGLLGVISEAQPVGGREFSAGHLQHIFEVYITGHFLAGLEWKGGSKPRDIISVLIHHGSSEASAPLANAFLQAFSLSALLHDCGRLLFPWWTARVQELARFDRGVGTRLAKVQTMLGDAAAEWLDKCRVELGEPPYLSTEERERLAVWVGERQARGEGAAALLGAWYLHRVGLRVNLDSKLRRDAVRAVLFDGIVNEPLKAKADPVGALLVLSDELFAWNPQPGLEVPFVHRLRSEGRPPPRFESIELLDLEFRIGKDGRVRGRFQAASRDKDLPVLPRFRVRLADPDGRPEDPVVETWLRLRQSLGRIELGLNGSWIEIEAKVPQRLIAGGLTCRRLLSEIADRAPLALRPSLESWIGSLSPETAPEGYERLSLHADGKPLHSGELEPYLPELERIEREVILEFASRKAHR